jgi:SHS2 domain-containing protein
MNRQFSILEHTADVGIEAQGQTLAEAFENAALGMMSLMYDLETVEKKEQRTVSIQARDIESLLVRWLSELLYLFDGEDFVPCSCEIESLHSKGLKGKVWGEPLDERKHKMKMYVKAVTYHQLSIQSSDYAQGVFASGEKQSVIRVYFDI